MTTTLPRLRHLPPASSRSLFAPRFRRSPGVLFADAEMQGVQISPTGRYLTWLAPKNQRMNLAILDRDETGALAHRYEA